MKYISILGFLMLVSLFSFDVSAVGLQDYLQSSTPSSEIATPTTSNSSPEILNSKSDPEITNSSNPLSYIIELVVAGIIGSALIISVLVMFLGRWAANKEKKIIKALRIEAEEEKDHVVSAAASVRVKEKESDDIVSDMKTQSKQLTQKIALADEHNEKIAAVTENFMSREKEIKQVTSHISSRMSDIQDYWSGQLEETISNISLVQKGLDSNLNKVDDGIETMQRQKELTQDLLQDFLTKHQEQDTLIKNNTHLSEKITENLKQTFDESNQLLDMLKQQKNIAEKSIKSFSEELTVYEEQAYEQFDTTFQVADLARQELNANIDESRTHIETMRRYEEQSHKINSQTQKNLEQLDYSKIMKLSATLDSTHDMFTDIRSRVDETKIMLDELKDIETDIRQKSSHLDNYEPSLSSKLSNTEEAVQDISKEQTETIYDTNYKMASGDITPLSFFTNINSKSRK